MPGDAMARAPDERERLDKEYDLLEDQKADAYDKMEILKGRLQGIERSLATATSPSEKLGLEREKTKLEIDYVRADRVVHSNEARQIDIGEKCRVLDGRVESREGLQERREALLGKIEMSRDAMAELKDSKIGQRHHSMEIEVAQKELKLVNQKLGVKPDGFELGERRSSPEMGKGLDPDDDFDFGGR